MTELDQHQIKRGVAVMFADGQERIIFPLTIRGLRKFVKIMEEMKNTSDMTKMTEEDVNLMMKASEIIMEKVEPSVSAEDLEDVIDIVSFNKIMSVAMGNSSPEE